MEHITRKLFTIDDYYRMAEVGVLRPDDRVELIHGEILVMSPIGTRHNAIVSSANKKMVQLAGDSAIVRIQSTVVLDQFCAPEPDVALLRPRDDFYKDRHPAGPDILLIIEVADSSLDYDTTVKVQLYAILGVEEYWVADLQNNRVLVYTEPAKDSYLKVTEFHRGDIVTPRLLPQCAVNADTLLL